MSRISPVLREAYIKFFTDKIDEAIKEESALVILNDEDLIGELYIDELTKGSGDWALRWRPGIRDDVDTGDTT